jgi:hypothetical protein
MVRSRPSHGEIDRSPRSSGGIVIFSGDPAILNRSRIVCGSSDSMRFGLSDRVQKWKDSAIDLALGQVGDVTFLPGGNESLGLFLLTVVGHQQSVLTASVRRQD